MTAHSKSDGWPILWKDGRWVYADTGRPVCRKRPCRSCAEDRVVVQIGFPGREGSKAIDVDACIAGIVQSLNDGGVPTIACCCGHGNRPGNIVLADGRELVICPDYKTARAVDGAFPDINGVLAAETQRLRRLTTE